MICPKCQNTMQTLDKLGVQIDRCESCHGIFLDKGELEQILNAESAYYEQEVAPEQQPVPQAPPAAPVPPAPPAAPMPPPYQPGPAPAAPYPPQQPYPQQPYPAQPYPPQQYPPAQHYPPAQPAYYGDSPRPYGYGHGHRRKKRSFLEDLFD